MYFDKLKPGAYQVREVSAPSGFVKDDQTYTVNVTSGTETSFVLKNQAKPGLIITKYDEQTHEVLPDVTFEVTRDTVLIGSFSTDEMGQIRLTDLQPGTYLVKEVSTSAGYVLDSTPQQIELTAGGGIKTLTFFNTVKPGIHIIKVDSRTMEPLANVKFRISLVGGTFSKEYVTDKNGEIDLTALEPGAYTVEEITAPNGYLMDEAKRIIQINAGENARFVFTNTEKPVLSVVKYDAENDTYLAGATFRIAKIEDGSHYLDRVTDTNGRISISDLEPGVYLEYEGQILRFEVEDKSLSTGVAITKTGPKEIVAGQPVRYAFSGIANTSNVSLSNFYWRDTLPAQVRLDTVVTGTYNRPGTYKIVYRVNGGGHRTLADNLSTQKNYTLAASATALKLASNERVTEIMFVFGQAPAGFAQVEKPYLHCKAVTGLSAGSFVNVADVGGTYGGTWVQGISRWVTTVYGKPVIPTLPKTGY